MKVLHEKLVESEKLMADTTRSWKEKLRQSEARKQEEIEQLQVSAWIERVGNQFHPLGVSHKDFSLSLQILHLFTACVLTAACSVLEL